MKIKKSYINISLLVLFLSLSVVGTINQSFKPQYNLETPRASDGEITIITPENKTYYELDDGYYPATYGFDNDLPGSEPSGWVVRQPDGDGFIEVDAIHAGHKNVVELRKTGGTDKAQLTKNFPDNATVGTIEYWLYKDTDSGIDPTRMVLGGDDGGLQFGIQSGDLYRGPFGGPIIASNVFTVNMWHHIRVDFNLSLGWQIQLDDIWYGSGYSFPFEGTPTKLYSFVISSIFSGDNPNYGAWLDALDYSWHINYAIGDNLNEGLLLSYNNTTNLDWQGYSLDGQANRTIYGNTTIPIPSNGHHSIQVFGNDTLGTYYESDLRYFTVNYEYPADISIITPENIVYNDPMSGYYPATYGFENDEDGTIPQDFLYGMSSGNLQVVSEIGGHRKIVQLVDTVTNGYPYLIQMFTSQTTGIVEFYVRKESGSTQAGVELRSEGTIATGIRIDYGDNGKFEVYQGASYLEIAAGDYSDQTWFHIKIDFDTSTDTADFYINGALKASNIAFKENVVSVDRIYFGPNYAYTGSFYIDALGYSWDPNYEIGNNLNESLLLSYDSIPILDWQGYSLDGQENITIVGNTTLPMLSNGLHSIQVFGNDLIGNNYQSNLIYFTVRFNNNIEPELTNGNVSPRIGDQTTEFNFTVIFWDEDNSLPSYVNVIINGTDYAMEKTFPSDDNYTDGCYYEYTTFLLPSEYNYSYYFECGDGRYTNTTTLFNNLKVNKGNYNNPQLLFPEVSPDYGGLTTDFVFSIWYYDLDDNYPLDVNITIDTSTFSMIQVNPDDTNATDGLEFSYSTNIDYGIHSFRFNCSDGLYSNSTNWIIGPEVNPLYGIDPIELLTPNAFSQIYSNLLNFSWSSLNAGFGAVNFTLQVSNISDFSHIIFQSEDIAETLIVTNFSIPLSITYGQYYWRVRPTYGNYNGSWSNYFSFTLYVNNFAPNLVLDDITPTDGTSSTIFRFTVIYSDLDNNAPEYVEILINGIPYSMEMVDPLDEDFTDGCIYQYLTLLTPSTIAYNISFECSDGVFQYSTSTYQGPLVESDSTPSDNQSDNNFNAINMFAFAMMLGIPIGILIPFIVFAEIKVRKMKLEEKTLAKIKKKGIKS